MELVVAWMRDELRPAGEDCDCESIIILSTEGVRGGSEFMVCFDVDAMEEPKCWVR